MSENDRRRSDVLGVQIDRISMQEALSRLDEFICQRCPRLIATANAEMVMLARKDADFGRILNTADLVLPDGAGVVWAARRLGEAVTERVAGYDLTQNLLQKAAAAGYRVYWLGASPGVAEVAAAKAAAKWPGLVTVGIRNGYFQLTDATVITEIRQTKPDILLCALGVPKQEKWLAANLTELQVPVSIGVGGTFDVMAGRVNRAPLWMQQASLEWLYRLICQPSRFGRMLVLPRFVLQVLRSAWTTR